VVVLATACSSQRPAPAPSAPTTSSAPVATLATPAAPSGVVHRNWDAMRLHAARRMVEANPDRSYTGRVHEPLLAIPVLEIELNGDGSVRRIDVLRQPSQARETVQMAVDAVRRAAPYGDISKLPRPWKFSEAFLFDDAKRFKPRSLDS